MNPPYRRTIWLWLGLGAVGPFLAAPLSAQESTPGTPPAPVASNEVRAPIPPTPPEPRAPLDTFRELLLMKPAQRDRALTNRPPQLRKLYLDKLREYDALKPDEREVRLRLTELGWYLNRLMRTPTTNRAAQLALVPEKDRQMVEERLQRWDQLAPGEQAQVLAYQAAVGAGTNSGAALSVTAAAGQDDLGRKLEDWNRLPAAQRDQMYARFKQFFELSPEEKQKTLHVLSDAERAAMQKALDRFEQLPSDRRQKCLDYFPSFAGMSPEERGEFLQNAERWQEMSPSARESWRALVSRLPPPPLPPGLGPPLPPMPRSVPMQINGSATGVRLAGTNDGR